MNKIIICLSIVIILMFITILLILSQYLKMKEKCDVLLFQKLAFLKKINSHFIFNSFATISAITEDNPQQAQNAINQLSNFMRGALKSLDEDTLISFEKEFDYVNSYIWIEQLRFKKRINIIINLGYTDFYVPEYSIQSIVQDAIFYGIYKKDTYGTLKIITDYEDGCAIVKICINTLYINDSQINRIMEDECNKRIIQRIKTRQHGNVYIESSNLDGTTFTIKIPKKENE